MTTGVPARAALYLRVSTARQAAHEVRSQITEEQSAPAAARGTKSAARGAPSFVPSWWEAGSRVVLAIGKATGASDGAHPSAARHARRSRDRFFSDANATMKSSRGQGRAG